MSNINKDFAVTLEGLDEAFKVLFAISAGSEKVMSRTMRRIATVNRDVIRQDYAPRSPTISDIEKSRGVKSGTFTAKAKKAHRRIHPGGLERSIEYEADANQAVIFIAANSEAGAYAMRIHDLKGIEWEKRGIGTISKGPKADDQFITRGINDHAKDSFAILENEQTKVFKTI